MAGIASIGCKLKYGTTEGQTANVLWSISNVPELEGAPENIDVTPITFGSRVYVPGVKATEPFEFQGFRGKYGDPDGEESAYKDEFAELKLLDGKLTYWELEWPDGSKHTWAGTPNTRAAGAEVNGGLGYVLNIMPSTPVEYTVPAD